MQYPVNSTAKICSYKYYGFKVIKLFGIPVGIAPILRIRNIDYHGQYPYDDAPAGYDDTQNEFAQNFNGVGLGFFGYGTTHNHFGHDFIPVVSALDLQNQGYGSSNLFQSNNLYGNIDNSIVNPGQVTGNTLNPTSLSPFSSVLTYTSDCGTETCQSFDDNFGYENANWNLHHEAGISNQASAFITRKILNANPTFNCPSLCNTTDIVLKSDASLICNTTMLHLTSLYPLDYNFNWSFPNGLLTIQSGQGTPDVLVKAIGSGTETATVVITNSCGQQATYTLNVTVGSPNSLTGTYSTSTNTYPIQTVNFVSSGYITGQFQWPQVSNITVTAGSGSTGTGFYSVGNSFSFTLASGQSMYLNFNGTGLCGPVSASRSFIQSGGYAIVASPNPATSDVNMNITDVADTTSAENSVKNNVATSSNTAGITKIYLYDITSGSLIKQWTYQEMKNNNYKLNVSGVKSGTYLLKMERNNKSAATKIIIKQ